MLPFIDLDLADCCKVNFNYCLGLYLPIGHSLWFDGGEVKKNATALHLNLDEYLTALLTSLIHTEKAETRVLTFYAAIPGRFALSLCAAEPLPFLHSRGQRPDLPGCLELRHDFIPQTAAPFLLYEGGMIHRLHPLTEPARTSFYVWDFSDYVGNFLKEVDKAYYFRVLNDKNAYYDYAVVPKNPRTSIPYRGAIISVQHAFCQVL
jgi:hypothetical protein